ncbi:MAG: NAD-dependent epimerase/dehydratase family protein [Proteobacteria bacterium]|nr:NAD-dependent epimerase/dehydratase family protein [Pseudomonadota bacterium]MCP4917634.1 NAD-dependent epimerase/dehydratase family protein [Pseudomonadota bacterium]
MARVLVTGAAGLLGAACVERLVARGDDVIALVRDRDPRSRLIRDGLMDRCIEVRAELADAERLLAEYSPDRVLHLAAQTQVPVANRSPLSTFESNVRGTWILLEACRTAAVRPTGVVVASSDKAYGAAPTPTPEDAPLAPTSPYDVSKACTDLIARSYASQFELPVVVTRCGNLYGPGDLNLERLVPGTCMLLARGEAPVLRSRGLMTRDWTYVDDAAAANLLLLDQAAQHAGEGVNVAGGEIASVLDIVGRLSRLAGSSNAPELADSDPHGEIPHQALETSHLASLGWSPTIDLDDGLARSLDWYRKLAADVA